MGDVFCIDCAHWSPKRGGDEMARKDYGACANHEAFVSFYGKRPRGCMNHQHAEESIVKARRAFVERQGNGE